MGKKLLGLPLLALGCLPAAREVPPAPAYRALAEDLEATIRWEMADHELPALSIALLDGERIVWARGFGWADPERKVAATASTVYRAASISKLFTAAAVMQEVERGRLNLDRPVSAYLGEFRPRNPFGRDITLRHLLSHHAGLLREPPAGHYFDPRGPGLEATVASLNHTELVHPPGERFKYSNAGPSVAGLVLERLAGEPFEEALERSILRPLGLTDTSFRLSPALERRLPKGFLWTYDGRVFEAPVFPLGTGPAGNLSTTVVDLARFAGSWFPGPGGGSPLLEPGTLEEMQRPQFAAREKRSGAGLGFFVDAFEGRLRVGHGGAIYGFASQLSALPAERLAVAVATTLDFSSGCAQRVADRALSTMLALRKGRAIPPFARPAPVGAARARELSGLYGDERSWIELHERGGDLYLEPSQGMLARIRARGEHLVAEDRIHTGGTLERVPGGVKWNGAHLPRMPDEKPARAPERSRPLIGEYGWDHDVLYVLERRGKLHILIEWFEYSPLEEVAEDRYALPERGLYQGETVQFLRDAEARITAVKVGAVEFARREVGGREGRPFLPLEALEELRAAARRARPPEEKGPFREPDLVDLTALDPTIRLDIRYATSQNFMGVVFYEKPRALLQRRAAEALLRAHRRLEREGYGLLVHDAYRPWYVTWMFWEGTPESLRSFVADPRKGSRHNRGCAVDLTLYHRDTGLPAEMVSGYDEFTPRAFPHYPGGTALARWHRELLRRTMEAEGFTVYPLEWWHFDYREWQEYAILNLGTAP